MESYCMGMATKSATWILLKPSLGLKMSEKNLGSNLCSQNQPKTYTMGMCECFGTVQVMEFGQVPDLFGRFSQLPPVILGLRLTIK